MSTGIKYLLLFATTAAIIFGTIWYGLNQNIGTRAIQEVKTMMSTVALGELRDNQSVVVDKKELVANMISEVAKSQKNHGYDIEIQYVFLDKQDKSTENESEIESVQFQIELLNEKKDVRQRAQHRISLDKVN